MRKIWIVVSAMVAAVSTASALLGADAGKGNSRRLFERRILPLLNASDPSSCAECHLSGVDLKDYIRPSEAETYASLLKQGLIDPAKPGGSKLLRLIKRSSPKSPMLTQQARAREYEAFSSWIAAAARNDSLARAKAGPIGPKAPAAVIRHTRKDRVVEGFVRNIWSQQGRCAGCHQQGSPGAARFAKQYGERVEWLIGDDPEATMGQLIAHKMVNIETPEKSMLLLKPLGEAKHGGGVKFAYGDRTFQLFLSWLQDYARTVRGEYREAKALPTLPPTSLAPTGGTLEIVDGPEAWIGKSLRVDVFAWDAIRNDWSADPIATADRPFSRGHGSLLPVFRVVPSHSEEARSPRQDARLEPGRYLLKFSLGTIEKPAGDLTRASPLRMMPVGQKVIEADWKPGRDAATKVTPP